MIKVYDHVNYIAGRFKNRNVFQKGKGILSHILWASVEEQFYEAAQKSKNKRFMELSFAISEIPPMIKNYVISEYIRRV